VYIFFIVVRDRHFDLPKRQDTESRHIGLPKCRDADVRHFGLRKCWISAFRASDLGQQRKHSLFSVYNSKRVPV